MKTQLQKAQEPQVEYRPTEAEEDVLALLQSNWTHAYQQKSRAWRQLRNLDVDTFMQRLRDHYNGYVEDLDIEQEWRSNIFKRKSRQKVLAVVASFVSSGLGVEITAQDLEQRLDQAMSGAVMDIYDWSLEREDFQYTFLKFLVELVVTGTAHLQEEIVWKEREVKEITDIDFETGKIKTEKKTRTIFKGCKSSFVPSTEIYIGDVWTHDIQDQPYLFRRQITTYQSAEEEFGKYDNWEYVQPGHTNFFSDSDDWNENDDDDSDENNVEVLRYWNKQDDSYHLVVNGVLLTDPDNPIPYPHKNYPMVKTVFETFADSRFYWGDSLVNKNYDEQEMSNKLTNMFMDATMLQTFPPLITTNAEIAGQNVLVPGVQLTMDENDDFRTIPEITKGFSNQGLNAIQALDSEIDRNSIDPLLSGQTPQGDPTATEVRAIVGSAERVRELNEQFIVHALIQLAHLRIPNLLWFVTHDDEYKKVVIDGVKTKNSGESGKRIIKFVDAVEMPKMEDILIAENELDKRKQPTDFVYVDKDSVNDYRYIVRVAVIRKPSRSQATRLSRIIAKYNLYAPNPLVDQRENTKMLIEGLGDDTERLLAAQQPAPETGNVKPPSASQNIQTALAGENQSIEQQLL